jgi:hypothetical protein
MKLSNARPPIRCWQDGTRQRALQPARQFDDVWLTESRTVILSVPFVLGRTDTTGNPQKQPHVLIGS